MKRLSILALIPGFVFASSVQADNEFPQAIVQDSYIIQHYPATVPLQMQIVRRVVPRTTYHAMTNTIMVPTTVLETRQVQSIEYRDEVHERTVTVHEPVAESQQGATEKTTSAPEIRPRTETYTAQVPYERLVPETYTVDKVSTEKRTSIRHISRVVPGMETRTTVTGGEILKRSVKSDLGGVRVQAEVVGGVKTEESVPVMRHQIVEQTFAHDVQVTRPETHTRWVKQTGVRDEIRIRTVPETVQGPKAETLTNKSSEVRAVPRQKTETYSVQVPYLVTRQVQVQVTRMVPHQVIQHVPVVNYGVIQGPASTWVP